MYPVVGGHPVYNASGTSQFIPEVWSSKLLVKFYSACVLTDISNTEYEGEIRNMGDKVYIRTTPDITISNYSIGQNLTYQRPESPSTSLTIDKGTYFGFTCDDIVLHQTDIRLMDDWSNDASYQMKIAVDVDVLTGMVGQSNASNLGNTAGRISGDYQLGASAAPLQLTKDNIVDIIVDCRTVLEEQNIPTDDLWMVLPAWAVGRIKKSDLKDASLAGTANSGNPVIRNGKIGRIDNFDIYSSNLLYSVTDSGTSGTCWYSFFGHKSALTFAAQLTKMESLRAESTFGDLIRGLNVYGYKVIKNAAMGELYITK